MSSLYEALRDIPREDLPQKLREKLAEIDRMSTAMDNLPDHYLNIFRSVSNQCEEGNFSSAIGGMQAAFALLHEEITALKEDNRKLLQLLDQKMLEESPNDKQD